ncbi:MAG: ABC transporter permease [Candidatus Rokubacteria bacterium]|nr:ABC transporter permease [Candidatus Rokubacteria bacterium]
MTSPIRQAASAFLLILLWHGLSRLVFEPTILPSPATVLGRAVELTLAGELPRHMATSLGRILVGYSIGAILGIAVGLVISCLPWVEELLTPSLGFIRSIPPIAFVPFSIILFGIGETSKYAVIVYLVFIVLALHTTAGVHETPRIRIRAAQALGAGGAVVLLKVILPSAFPFILNGLRVGLSLSFMAVVSAELIGAQSGLGYMIMDSQTMFATDKMLVGILCLGILGALIDCSANELSRRLLARFAIPGG